MDYKSMLEGHAKEWGREGLYPYAFGAIRSILASDSYANGKKVKEIKNVMECLDEIYSDTTLPWSFRDIKIAPTAMEAGKINVQTDCTIDASKVELLLSPSFLEASLKESLEK